MVMGWSVLYALRAGVCLWRRLEPNGIDMPFGIRSLSSPAMILMSTAGGTYT